MLTSMGDEQGYGCLAAIMKAKLPSRPKPSTLGSGHSCIHSLTHLDSGGKCGELVGLLSVCRCVGTYCGIWGLPASLAGQWPISTRQLIGVQYHFLIGVQYHYISRAGVRVMYGEPEIQKNPKF